MRLRIETDPGRWDGNSVRVTDVESGLMVECYTVEIAPLVAGEIITATLRVPVRGGLAITAEAEAREKPVTSPFAAETERAAWRYDWEGAASE